MEETYEPSIFDEEQIQVVYAGFWERFGALFLDGLILAPLTVVNMYNHTSWKSMAILILASLACLVYKPLLEYLYGATPGKKALSITVTNLSYEKPNLQEALLRNIFGIVIGLVSLYVSILVFNHAGFADATTMAEYSRLQNEQGFTIILSSGLGILYIVDAIVLLADKQNRSLHDMIGKTYVIKK